MLEPPECKYWARDKPTPASLGFADGVTIRAVNVDRATKISLKLECPQEAALRPPQHYTCKLGTPLVKVMHAYCERQGVELSATSFDFDGATIAGTQTPWDLAMEEGDVIEVRVRVQLDLT